jgi:hypothetical protein
MPVFTKIEDIESTKDKNVTTTLISATIDGCKDYLKVLPTWLGYTMIAIGILLMIVITIMVLINWCTFKTKKRN